jgi:hypothetical protein
MDYYIYRSISYLQFFIKNGAKESAMHNVFWYFLTTFYEERYKLFLVKSICIQYKVLPSQYANLVSSEDVKNNVSPKPLQERINRTLKHLEEFEMETSETLKYKNHSGYSYSLPLPLPLTMDIKKKWGYTVFNKDYTSASCWGYNKQKYFKLSQTSKINSIPVLYSEKNINGFS